jgi:hypothetical protein
MRKFLLPWTAFLGTAVSLIFSSCTYDPYYAGGYYGGTSGGYYGDGYGYGSSSFSTSLFVTTGDPRWGYDPYTYCYYDYGSRRYYDPYLYGYYPVGYRPYAVYGVPHPYGWRQGHGHCPPPRTVRNVTVVNYRNRESAYRNSNYSWARQVKERTPERSYRQSDSISRPYSGRQTDYRTDSRTRQTDSFKSPSWAPRETSQPRSYTPNSRGDYNQSRRSDYRSSGPSSSEQAVKTYTHQTTREHRPEASRFQSTPRPQPTHQLESPKVNRGNSSYQPREQAPASDNYKKTESWKSNRKGLRSLGDG